MPLHVVMLALGLAVLLPALVAGLVDCLADIRYFHDQEQRRLTLAADRVAAGVDRDIAELRGLLAGLAGELAARPQMPAAALHRYLTGFARPLGLEIALRGADGTILADTAMPSGAMPWAAASSLLAALRAAPGGGVSNLVPRPGHRQPAALVFQPVPSAGPEVLTATLPEARLQAELQAMVVNPLTSVQLFDAGGALVAGHAPPGQTGLRGAPALDALQGPGDLLPATAGDGLPLVATAARLREAPGWLVVISEPASTYYGSWVEPLVARLAAYGAAVLVALAAALWSGRRLTRPLILLGERAEAAAAGSASPVAVPQLPVREFEVLRQTQFRAERALARRAAAENAALREARTTAELLASVMNGSTDLVHVTGLDGRFVLVNRATRELCCGGLEEWRMLGRRPAELLGAEYGAWLDEPDAEVLATGRTNTREGSWQRPGAPPRIFSVVKSPWRDASGEIAGIVTVARDVTEQRAAEARLRRAQAELLRATRLSAMGAMGSGLAHELNQPLSAAANFLGVAERRAATGEAAPEALHEAVQQVQRAGEIVRRLRDFVSRGEPELVSVELGALLAETEELAHADGLPGNCVLSVRPPAAPLAALADPVQIQQVLLNLIRNAAEALAGQPRAEDVPGQIVLEAAEDAAGGVRISVADDGPGLPEQVRAQLFAPFVSTKRDGMGIGLAICHTIIEGHGGELAVETGADGTVFRVSLPPARRAESQDESTEH